MAFKACSMHLWSRLPELHFTGRLDKQSSRPEHDAASLQAYIAGVHCSTNSCAVAHQEGSNGSERVSRLLMQATISCTLVILSIAIDIELLLTQMASDTSKDLMAR